MLGWRRGCGADDGESGAGGEDYTEREVAAAADGVDRGVSGIAGGSAGGQAAPAVSGETLPAAAGLAESYWAGGNFGGGVEWGWAFCVDLFGSAGSGGADACWRGCVFEG